MTEDEKIDQALDQIIRDNPLMLERARDDAKIMNWFVGEVMRITHGSVNPAVIARKVNDRISIVWADFTLLICSFIVEHDCLMKWDQEASAQFTAAVASM